MFYKSIARNDLDEICELIRGRDVCADVNQQRLQTGSFKYEIVVFIPKKHYKFGQIIEIVIVLKAGESVWVEDIFTETKIQAGFDLAMGRLDEARKRIKAEEEAEKERQEQARERAEKLLHDQLRALLEAQQAELRSETTLALEALELVRPGQWMPEIPIDAQVIKTAYRKAAKKHHPDAGGSESEFKRIHAAYERLQKVYSRS